ncbi:acetyltransferase (GNAT) family protein [Microterricola gilva]|uniref:Acetyltransferase (GNAT) family protein n=1 Tax=Microterricola gilva TaxID=393267 RepID=A0A4Q8AMM2_9MICO|nr:GNAT family N-acetyltransferase [Microterricola gilva]RZU65263.1 acetyltransferase (GNAT) family protein [Microterricola gilva]
MSEQRGASSVVSADSAFWTESWMPRERVETSAWLLRADRGVTNRANSAVPRGSADTAIEEFEAFYAERALPRIAQIPNHAPFSGLDGKLARRGYTLHTPTLVQLLRLRPEHAGVGGAAITDEPSAEWTASYLATDGRGDERADSVQLEIVGRSPARYLMSADSDVAVTRLSVHGDIAALSCMGVADAHRGRGHGAQLLRATLGEAAALGCSYVALQVAAGNVAALRLYGSAGFATVDRYHYRVGPVRG